MSRKAITWCVVLGVALLLFVAGTAIKAAWDNRDGRCFVTRPLGEHYGGYVWHFGLTGAGVNYLLLYPGTYEHSGKACRRGVSVTEAQYNWKMYGIEP